MKSEDLIITSPKVTVLMPVFNGEKYIKEAIESILSQTFKDFEFLIINDGSTDGSVEIVRSYNDSRIQLINNETNFKLIFTLNKGLKLAKGKYVARQDADDISMPDRLQKQVYFLDKHKDIYILGSNLTRIDASGNILRQQPLAYPQDPGIIKWLIPFRNCIQHPTVMVRKETYLKLGGYDLSSLHVEDYELWLRASFNYKMANLKDKLVLYRVHGNSVSVENYNIQRNNTIKVVSQHITSLLGKDIDNNLVQQMMGYRISKNSQEGYKATELLYEIYKKTISSEFIVSKDKKKIEKDAILRLLQLGYRNKASMLLFIKTIQFAFKVGIVSSLFIIFSKAVQKTFKTKKLL